MNSMKIKITFLLTMTILSVNSLLFGQSAKKVNSFPEDYVEKTITFNNTRYKPILTEFGGYYTVQIDIAASIYDEREWGFQIPDHIIGVVDKEIAKQMINKDIGGYKFFYYGSVTGKVIKSDNKMWLGYWFIITKIINYPPDEPQNIIDQFEKK